MKLSSIVVGMLTVTTITLSYIAFNLNKDNDKYSKGYLALSEENTQLTNELKKLKDDLSGLHQKLNTSQASIASFKNELAKQKRVVSPSVETSTNIKPVNQIKTASPVKAEKISDTEALIAFAKRIQSGEKVEDKIRKQLHQQEVDSDWAYEYEANIQEFVAADENNRFDIQELNCRTTACELKITATESNAMLLGTLFSKKLGEQDWRDQGASVIFNHEVKDGAMSILIGRDKNSFNN